MLKFIDCVLKGLIAVEILRLGDVRVDVVAAVTGVVMASVMAVSNAVMSAAGVVVVVATVPRGALLLRGGSHLRQIRDHPLAFVVN